MLAAKGILTSRGGRTSHAALVARQFGKPAVVGVAEWLTPRLAEKRSKPSTFTAGAFTRAVKRDPRFGGAPAGTGGAPGGFRIGQNVMHAKFGAGVIVDAEGQGTDARVQVNFGREGVKWLAVAVAKLQAA
jgi:DNA helicase-2/ATP-dependent DNA helicase PcrA